MTWNHDDFVVSEEVFEGVCVGIVASFGGDNVRAHAVVVEVVAHGWCGCGCVGGCVWALLVGVGWDGSTGCG